MCVSMYIFCYIIYIYIYIYIYLYIYIYIYVYNYMCIITCIYRLHAMYIVSLKTPYVPLLMP